MNELYLAFSAISDTQYKSSSHCFILTGKELYILTLSYNTLFVSFVVWQLQTLATVLTRQIDSFLENNCHNVVKVNR